MEKVVASVRAKEKEKDEAAVGSSRRRKAAATRLKISLLLGKHGIGKIKARMKIGPGKKQKNPMPPKEKERKGRKAKEKASGARMVKVMARITFPMQLQKVQVLPLHSQKQLPHQLSSLCTTFPVSLRLRERKRFQMMFLNHSQDGSIWPLQRVRRLTSHMR